MFRRRSDEFSGRARSADAKFVHPLKRSSAFAANDGHAITANQGSGDRFAAFRAIQFDGAVWFAHIVIMAVVLAAALSLTGCARAPQKTPAIEEAYVGPISLNLRKELAQRSEVTATVRHGERLEILEYRRRFAKVRNEKGAEGWTDGRQLIKPEQMARLRRFGESAAQLPGQGQMTPFDVLNVHIEPNRQSPSFYQIPEGGKVEMIGRKVMARVPYTPGKTEAPPPGTPMESWSLVRLGDGRAGWVLSRMMMMAIPDEVAQYAEGHHITSYFSLGSVMDQGQERHHWLWTTIASQMHEHDFDSFRVFVWSTRRHRYETAYIERNLKGHYPVQVHPRREGASMPRFSLIFAGRDGVLSQRTYEFQGYHVRMIAKEPWQLSKALEEEHQPVSQAEPRRAEPAGKGLLASVAEKLKEILRR